MFDVASVYNIQKAVQLIRNIQAQGSLLYGKICSDIMVLNRIIKKI